MAASIKKISELEKTNALSASSTVIIEENGKAKRFSANDIGKVKTINGIEPDESGNIEIAVLDGDAGVSSEQIMDVIEEYFEENPIEQPKDSGFYRIEASIMDGNILRIDHKASNTDMVDLPPQFVKLPGFDLPVGGVELGGVKNGGNVVINEDGTMDAPVGGSGSSVQADLAQNDETAPDYVKGRTHWVEAVEKQLIDEVTIEVESAKSMIAFPETFQIVDGRHYDVIFNGEHYKCIATTYSGLPIIGNLACDNRQPDTGEPFLFTDYANYNLGTLIQTLEAGTFVVSIGESAEEIKQLDDKFIPDTIARIEHVDNVADDIVNNSVARVEELARIQPDFYQNDETAIDFIKNRTHWEEHNIIKYDGNPDGKDSFEYSGTNNIVYKLVKISDTVPTMDELDGANVTVYYGVNYDDDEPVSSTLNKNYFDKEDECGVGNYMVGYNLLVVGNKDSVAIDNKSYITVPSTGVYAFHRDGRSLKLSYGSIIHQLDEKFIPDTIARKSDIAGGSGVTSWNDLTDKPFGEESANMIIEWDGNIEGRDQLSVDGEQGPLYKISDLTPTEEELRTFVIEATDGTNTIEYTEELFNFVAGENVLTGAVLIVLHDVVGYMDGSTITAPSPGVYALSENGYVSKFSYSATTTKKLDSKFLPDDIPVSWDHIMDKPFGEEGNQTVIEWDGSNLSDERMTTNKGEFPAVFCKISDLTPSYEDLLGAEISIGEESGVIEEGFFYPGQNILISEILIVMYDVDATPPAEVVSDLAYHAPSPGIYGIIADGYNIKLSYGSTTIKTLDEKYFPDTIARVSDIEMITVDATFDNPTFTSSINMGRKTDSEVGCDSVAIGRDCVANLDYCVAIGDTAEATNYSAIAIGTDVVAGGMYSHAGGYETDSLGYVSYTEGAYTKATGDYSHAEGYGTIASTTAQHVQGKYNLPDEDSKYLHIIGNGESDSSRSNAHTVDKDGNGWFAGTVEGTALILKAPNGTRYQITVDNNGALSAIEIEQD